MEDDLGGTELNVRQERFAQIVVEGRCTQVEAYQAVYGEVKGAEASASRLLSSAKVSERVAALRQRAALGAVISRQELLEYLTRGILVPLGQVDERSNLCQAAEYLVTGGVRGKLRRGNADGGNEEEEPEMTTVKIKMVDKLRSAELIAKLQGWLKEEHKVTHGLDDELTKLLGDIRLGE